MSPGNFVALEVQLIVLGFGDYRGLLEQHRHDSGDFNLFIPHHNISEKGLREDIAYIIEYMKRAPLTEFSLEKIAGYYHLPCTQWQIRQEFGTKDCSLMTRMDMVNFFRAAAKITSIPSRLMPKVEDDWNTITDDQIKKKIK
jgi:hypothetical protein